MELNFIAILEELFNVWKNNQIVYVHLRKKEITLENIFKGDFDFFVMKKDMDSIKRAIYDVCSKYQINFLIDTTKDGKTKIVFFVSLSQRIVFEIWNFLDVKDSTRQYSKFIDAANIIPFIKKNNNYEDYVLDERIESLYYLSHMYSKNKNINNAEVQFRLNYYLNLMDNYIEIKNIFTDLIANKITILDASVLANQVLFDLRFLNKLNLFKELKRKVKIEFNKVQYFFTKRRTIIPFMGPDGVGKTTVIELVQKRFNGKYYRFKKMFRKSPIYNLYYYLYKTFQKDKVKNCSKNQIDDLMGLHIVCISLISYFLISFKFLFSKRYILSDRYFYDYFFQNIRFDDKKIKLNPNKNLLMPFIPKTKYSVHLDAPIDIIYSRKQEMLLEDIGFYQLNLFDMMQKRTYYYIYINTANDLLFNDTILQSILEIKK